MKKRKLLTRISNIEDISVSVEYFKEKYFPDILKEVELLESIVEQIKIEPRILYDENYVKGWKDELTLERESKVKIVINLLQSVLNELEDSNIILHGGVDDIWFDQRQEKLIVVDYKSQASSRSVTTDDYLAGVYHQSYKIQLDFYAYLLTKMGFDVSPVGYFYVCNADREAPGFNGRLIFQETLVPYEWSIDWIDAAVRGMIDVLNSYDLPKRTQSCENCAYAHQRALMEINDV